MLVFTGSDLAAAPPHFPYSTIATDHLVLRSDRAGGRPVYVYCDGNHLVLSSHLTELLDHLLQRGLLEVAPDFTSHLLQSYVVPPPRTCFKDLYLASAGDEIQVARRGGGWHLSTRVFNPFPLSASRQDSDPSPATLASHLANAAGSALDGRANKTLFLSSGKDSIPLAIAAADSGHSDVLCLTYGASGDSDETEVARTVAHRLGLRHTSFRINPEELDLAHILPAYFREQPFPNVDFAALTYPVLTAQTDLRGCTVLDGAGSDVFIGHVPTTKVRQQKRWSLPKALQRQLRHVYPSDAPLSGALRCEAQIDGLRGCFFPREQRRFDERAVDTLLFLDAVQDGQVTRDPIDRRSFLRGRYPDQEVFMRKVRNAGDAYGWRVHFPWCDTELASYIFDLPEQYRFDRDRGLNKVILRQYIRDRVSVDVDRIGKRFFGFDYTAILKSGRGLVLDEIGDCDWWRPGTRAFADRMYQEGIDHKRNKERLYCLFMISGWLNHSKYAKKP